MAAIPQTTSPKMPPSNLLPEFLTQSTQVLPTTVKKTAWTDPNNSSVSYLRLQSRSNLTLETTDRIDDPTLYISFIPHRTPRSATLHFLAFQCCEFALPVRAPDSALHFDFFSRPGFVRPHSVFPLIAMDSASDQCVLLAPVDAFHEQVLAVRPGDDAELRWGWSGCLQSVHADFQTTMAVISGTSPRELLRQWGAVVRANATSPAVNCRGRYADVCTAKLSLWTDNGASYWYRTEKGYDLPTTLEKTVRLLEEQNVPVASVELDSWFYPHEITRKVTDISYLDVVPPTGMLRWEPRHDVLGDEGVKGLQERIGKRPLILHSRHISSKSDYLTDKSLKGETWWVDGDFAHPQGAALFRIWMQQAEAWGATAYEQDWLVEIWQGVRQLRQQAGRIQDWQHQLNDAAHERNIGLIWCMATPADMAQAVSLNQIVAMRSCDDYRYAKDPSILWRWHLTVSSLIRSLGLWPFKDVFMSHGNESGVVDIEGDPNALLEACLSALSAGPVGIGDRMGRTVSKIVRATCRSDGVLVKPDLPLAALDRSLRNPNGLLWAETNCGPWRYILCVATGLPHGPFDVQPLTESIDLGDDETLIYEWRSREARVGQTISASLRRHEWQLWVVCPITYVGGMKCSLVGDISLFATMGDRRFRTHSTIDEELCFDVVGVPGERITVGLWSDEHGLQVEQVKIPSKGWQYACVSMENNGLTLQSNDCN